MSTFASRRPERDELSSDYHRGLIAKVQDDCVITAMEKQQYWLCELASSLSTAQVDMIHKPYGWTIRQVMEHCANAERVFGYRMLRFAAGDATELPGWAENDCADEKFGLGNFGHIVTEMGALRQSNLMLLRRIQPNCWDRSGIADGNRVNVRSIAWLSAGHLQHHLEIIEKRTGVTADREPPTM